MDFPRICPARWLTDRGLGMCMLPHDFLHPFYDAPSSYLRPWNWQSQSVSKEFGSTIENEKGNYKINLDVKHFRPNDISVKVTDCEIIVEGKHEERQDSHGFISRQFRRRYALPKQCPAEKVTSIMSSDGILTIIAEKRSSNDSEKIVPIKMCGICPRKSQIDNKIITEKTEKSVKENIIKDNTRDDFASKNTQLMLKEDHSRLLKPELFKETILDSDKIASKQEINTVVTTDTKEKMTAKKERLTEKKDLMTENKDLMTGTKDLMSEEKDLMTEKKDLMTEKRQRLKEKKEELAEKEGMIEKMDAINIGATSSKIEESLAKFNLGLAELTEQLGQRNIASTSEMCGIKGTSTRVEESSSSFISSSSMSSTVKSSGQIGECVSDIISAELREAAENV